MPPLRADEDQIPSVSVLAVLGNMSGELVDQERWSRDRPETAGGLCLARQDLELAGDLFNRLGDGDGPSHEVDVADAKSDRLPPAKPQDPSDEHQRPVATFDRVGEAEKLLSRQRLALRWPHLRQGDPPRWRPGDQVGVDRGVEDRSNGGDVTHERRRRDVVATGIDGRLDVHGGNRRQRTGAEVRHEHVEALTIPGH